MNSQVIATKYRAIMKMLQAATDECLEQRSNVFQEA